jgi:hypothetical protein
MKQNSQCTYNVTLRRVRELLLPWESIKYYLLVYVCMRVRACKWVPGPVGLCMCMRISACGIANPACNEYAPYCDVICGPFGSTIFFFNYLRNGAIFGNTSLNIKYVS